MNAPAPELYYDQYSYEVDDNPYEIFRRLRDEAPVWRNEKYNYWVLSRYDDVLKASMDWQNFSSAWGTVLELMSATPGEVPLMINNDPPYHDQLRAVVAHQFTPAAVAKLEEDIREIVVSYLEPLEGRDSFDFIQDFGRWIPMDVVSHILGIPAGEERRQINQWADDSLARNEDGSMTEAGMNAMGKAMGYFTEVLNDRKENPRGDFLSYLSHAEIDQADGSKRPFTVEESLFFMVLISSAGNETVARLLSNTGVLLARHPEQRQKLRDNPKLIPRAIEELLRYEPPSPIQFRRLLNDVEYHGVTMKKGDNVALLTAAATRDDRHWDNPEVFDIERAPRRHVTFGYGPHTCLGASVARLESKIAIEEVLKRIGDWDVVEDQLKRVRTSTVRGYSHVPIVIKK